MRDHKFVTLGCRVGFGFFAVYLTVMVAAMLSPAGFDLVMGLVGLRWTDFSGLPPGGELNLALMQNMNLCGLIPTAFMAARVGFLGKWTPVDRAFFLCMLGANLLVNVWSIASNTAMASVIAGDFVLVAALISLAGLRRPASESRESDTSPAVA